MPATRKRIRPVIEEILEPTPARKEETPSHAVHDSTTNTHKRVRVEEEVPVETQLEVATYDEPPLLEKAVTVEHAEAAARELLASDHSSKKGPNLKVVFFVTILTALVVGFIAGGIYVYESGVSGSKDVQNTPTPSPEATDIMPTPKPSPTPAVVPSTYTLSVLNGSGVIGAASKVKAALEDAGFKVTGTGNAANYNFKNTVIQTKASVPDAAVDLLKKALKDYVVEEGDALPASSTFDIIVTAGKG